MNTLNVLEDNVPEARLMFLVLLWLYYLIGPFGVYLVVADVVLLRCSKNIASFECDLKSQWSGCYLLQIWLLLFVYVFVFAVDGVCLCMCYCFCSGR